MTSAGGRTLGFIGYRQQPPTGAARVVRIYLECQEKPLTDRGAEGLPQIICGEAVDVLFPGGTAPCRLCGVDGVLVLKKFYKLVFSLEERAREHGNDWRAVMESPERLLEHLRYTRNARDFTGRAEPQQVSRLAETADAECAKVVESS